MISLATLVATFLAGLASFLAPCTVPLLPAYIACVSGVSAGDLMNSGRAKNFRGRLLLGSLLYVAGFTSVFVVLGLSAGGLARLAQGAVSGRLIQILGGSLIILFGLSILGVLHFRGGERTFGLALAQKWRGLGVVGAFPVGVVFGLTWTPCVGPFLAAALTLAAISAQAASGALLLVVYALGLGLPFILAALLVASLPGLPARLNTWIRPATWVGGLVTVGLGVLLVSGLYGELTSFLVQLSTGH